MLQMPKGKSKMKFLCKALMKAALLAIPFGWFLLAVALIPDGGLWELILVLAALAAAIPAMQLIGWLLWPLLSEQEKQICAGR